MVTTKGPTILLDVDGKHRRKYVPHVVCASGAAVEGLIMGPAQHPSVHVFRSLFGEKAYGQQYVVHSIGDNATLTCGTLWVKFCLTEYRHPTPRRALVVAAHVLSSAIGSPVDAATAVGASEGIAAVPMPAVRA